MQPAKQTAKPTVTDGRRLVTTGVVVLGIGFVATAAGSVWVILSPIGGGVNFGAAAVYLGGMLCGVVGLVLGIAGLVALRRGRAR